MIFWEIGLKTDIFLINKIKNMKAKQIAKLRKKIKHYGMWRSTGLFGIPLCKVNREPEDIIYGTSPLDAIMRYFNKHPFDSHVEEWFNTTTSHWAKIAILEEGLPVRFTKFYR